MGTIAYRQCYRNCSDSEWAVFREKFDVLMMKQWKRDSEAGYDSRAMLDKWEVFWIQDEKLEDLSMEELREFVTPL